MVPKKLNARHKHLEVMICRLYAVINFSNKNLKSIQIKKKKSIFIALLFELNYHFQPPPRIIEKTYPHKGSSLFFQLLTQIFLN